MSDRDSDTGIARSAHELDSIPDDPEDLARLVREHRILRDAVLSSPLPFAIYDENDNLVAWNDAYEAIHPEAFAAHRDEAESGTLTYETLIGYQIAKSHKDGERNEALARRVARHKLSGTTSDLLFYESTGHHKVYRYALPGGGVAGVGMDVNDLIKTQDALGLARQQAERVASRLEAANSVIEQLANSDELTGLGNRRMLVDTLVELRKDDTRADQLCVCLQFDLDGFKHINDNLGHAAGDHVLREFANILRELARPDDLAVRLGGDEFALLLFGDCDIEDGRDLAQRAIDRLAEPIMFNGSLCRVGVSAGIATCPMSELDIDGVLIGADLAMYQAKQGGAGNVRVFDTSVKQAVQTQTELPEMITGGLAREEFVPHYQPQFSTADMSITGVEALLRWKDEYGQLRRAGQFLDAAKGHSLIGALDRQMYERVSEDMDVLAERGHLPPKVSLNVGYERLLDPTLVSDMTALARPELRVAIELLETLPLEDADEQLSTILRGLHENDVEIEIDRFGSDRASLATLVAISPSTMKIGHQIVQKAPESSKMRTLIRAIVEIGRRFEVEVTAQGVSNEEQFALVRRLGCGHAQGLWLGEPISRDELATLLEERALLAAPGEVVAPRLRVQSN